MKLANEVGLTSLYHLQSWKSTSLDGLFHWRKLREGCRTVKRLAISCSQACCNEVWNQDDREC